MKQKTQFMMLLLGIVVSACSVSQKAEVRPIFIGPTTQTCSNGVMQMECLVVKWTDKQPEWEFLYNQIEGFTYEKGFEYELLVETKTVQNPPADGSSVSYKLVREVSKKKIDQIADNSQNSLDWAGTYVGLLPCADCEGILTNITLKSDGSYQKTEVYNGKGEKMFIESGTFTWYDAGSKIRLNTNQMYQVGENQLIHLDQEGNKPTGDLALHYVLNKQLETPIASSPIENKKWILTQFQGSEIPYNATENFIVFDASTKQMSTKVGCNSISGTYQIVGELGLKFESMLSTLMACPNNNLEDEYTEALRTVDNFTTDGEFLHLNRARMIVASFKILK